MILATFENTDKTKKAEVCQQDNILVIKFYENDQYLYMQISGRREEAEVIAENWTL